MARRKADRGSFREKHGSLYWRGKLPEKTEDGDFFWRSCERCTRTLDPKKAREVADAWIEAAYTALAKPSEKKRVTGLLFAEAVIRYVKNGGANKEYLPAIVREIGRMPIADITQEVIDDLAAKLYPGRTAATLNRHVYTPICAVLNKMVSKEYTPPRIRRPKGHLAPSNFQRPPKDWFARVLAECEPHVAAFILFCRLHGRRTSEALGIKPSDIDADKWRVTIHDTKVGQDIVLTLAAPVVEQLERYPWRLEQFVFKYASRWSIYKPIRKACERAGVPYHRPKDTGRHSWATWMLEDEGMTLKEVQEAGRWKTIKMPALHYSHLERNRVDDRARTAGEKWAQKTLHKAEVISPSEWAVRGRGKQGEIK